MIFLLILFFNLFQQKMSIWRTKAPYTRWLSQKAMSWVLQKILLQFLRVQFRSIFSLCIGKVQIFLLITNIEDPLSVNLNAAGVLPESLPTTVYLMFWSLCPVSCAGSQVYLSLIEIESRSIASVVKEDAGIVNYAETEDSCGTSAVRWSLACGDSYRLQVQ